MAASQGCNDDKDVVERFTEALKQRIGEDRFGVWFDEVTFRFVESSSDVAPYDLVVTVAAQFALDRISKNFLSQLRGAASQACGQTTSVRLELSKPRQVGLPLGDDGSTIDQPPGTKNLVAKANTVEPASLRPKGSRGGRRGAKSMQTILRDGATNRQGANRQGANRQARTDRARTDRAKPRPRTRFLTRRGATMTFARRKSPAINLVGGSDPFSNPSLPITFRRQMKTTGSVRPRSRKHLRRQRRHAMRSPAAR